jgi:hypothetical protein
MIGLLLLTAGLFGVAITLNILILHAMAQSYEENYMAMIVIAHT